MLSQVILEFRRALRRLWQSKGFASFAITTLALGIGVTTAAYAVIYSEAWRETGVADAAEVAFLREVTPLFQRKPAAISRADFEVLTRGLTSVQSPIAWSNVGTVLSANGVAELARGTAVNGAYFQQLGITAAAGRLLQPADDEPSGPLVIVVGEQTWRRQLGARSDVIGMPVKIGDRVATIVGVAPAGFRGVSARGDASTTFWMPLSHVAQVDTLRSRWAGHVIRDIAVAARVPAGGSIERASDQAARLGRQLDDATPLPPPRNPLPGTPTGSPPRNWSLAPLEDATIGDGEVARLIIALPGLVLVVACMNLANLMLSRGISRRYELTVRAALGASRWRLVREQAMEGAIIAVIGAAGGLLIARGLISMGVVMVQDALANTVFNTSARDWRFDAGATSGAIIAGAIALFVAGVLPAIRLTRTNVRSALDLETAASLPSWKGRGNLIALQVGVSVGLFLIAAMFVRMTIRELGSVRGPDADLRGVAAAVVPFAIQSRDEARARDAVQRILAALHAHPDLDLAAVASKTPFVRNYPVLSRAVVARPGERLKQASERDAEDSLTLVTPDYLRLADLRLVSGRFFTDADDNGSPDVVIINEGVAFAVFGTRNVVGQELVMQVSDPFNSNRPAVSVTIVGVVAGGRPEGRVAGFGGIYAPLDQIFDNDTLVIFARARDRGDAPITQLRSAIRRADPDLAIYFAVDANQLTMGPREVMRLAAGALVGLATIALLLSMSGLYGVLSHVVFRRTREMGVRIALGASRQRIARLVVKDGFRPVLEGLFIGLGAAIVIRMFLRSQFVIEMSPIDPVAFGLAVVLLLGAASIACFLPARRATRVDPNTALREL